MPKGALIAGSGTHRTPGLRSRVGAPDSAIRRRKTSGAVHYRRHTLRPAGERAVGHRRPSRRGAASRRSSRGPAPGPL